MGKRRAEAFEFSGLYRSRAAFAAGEEGGDFGYNAPTARVAELVDALDLGSSAERHVGSSPSFRTTGVYLPVFSGIQQGKFNAASSPEHPQPARTEPHRFRACRADRG